ncbi:MAG TPA: hypothetical protein VMF91_04210 [Bryobacteraceae bacterium]|nr:hypothetical protein [Bryobacteraceae bacterium]
MAVSDARGGGPKIESALYPGWYRNCADVATFPHQVGNDPMILSNLQIVKFKINELRAAQTAPEEYRQYGLVALAAKCLGTATRDKPLSFFSRNPIAGANSKPLHSFDSGDPGRQIRTEQTGVGSLKGKSADRGQPQIDGRRGISGLLKKHSVPQHHNTAERESWLRTIPVDKFVDRVIVGAM